MVRRDLPDIYARARGREGSCVYIGAPEGSCVYIRQIPPDHVITFTYLIVGHMKLGYRLLEAISSDVHIR